MKPVSVLYDRALYWSLTEIWTMSPWSMFSVCSDSWTVVSKVLPRRKRIKTPSFSPNCLRTLVRLMEGTLGSYLYRTGNPDYAVSPKT